VAFVASPELFPRIRQAHRWTTSRAKGFWSSMQRVIERIRRRREVSGHDVGTAVETAFAMPIDASRGFPPDTTPLPERVAYIQKVVEELVFRLASLEGRLQALSADLRSEIRTVRNELSALIRTQIRESAESHLEWRYAGLTLLFVGLALATAGNLVT
jgi:hypothetical protein